MGYQGKLVYVADGWCWVMLTHKPDGEPAIMRQIDGSWLTPFRAAELSEMW